MYNERKLYVSFDYNIPVLTWETYKDSVKYNVYRGVTENNLEKIKETNLLQYRDSDISFPDSYDYKKYYYQIGSVDINNKETKFTELVQLKKDFNSPYKNVIKEIVRRNNLMLNRISGEDVDFYLKKYSGERCPECFNEVTRDTESEKEQCEVCYNTSFVGGFEVITGKCRILNAEDVMEETPYGFKLSSEGKSGFMSVYPITNTGDFLRTSNGEIYLINTVKKKRFQGTLTRQQLTLSLLQITHPYYSINLS